MEWQKLRWPRQPGASEECQPFEREDDDDDDNDDYIYYDEVSVCLSVTKNHHFLLGVSCNHLNHP